MNSENAPNKIVQSFIDLVSMAKGLIDENQQPSPTQKLGRLLSSTRGRGREVKAESFLGLTGESTVSATDTNNTNFATGSTTKQMIEEIWGSKATSMHAACNYTYRYRYNHGSLCSIKQPQEKYPVNLLFFPL